MSAIEDKKFALSGDKTCTWRAEEILRSAEFRKEYATRPNVIVAEDMVEKALDAIIKAARTGKIGDGKIFVTDVGQVVRIRTGETDEDAV